MAGTQASTGGHCTQGLRMLQNDSFLLPGASSASVHYTYSGHGPHPGREEIITPPVSVTAEDRTALQVSVFIPFLTLYNL